MHAINSDGIIVSSLIQFLVVVRTIGLPVVDKQLSETIILPLLDIESVGLSYISVVHHLILHQHYFLHDLSGIRSARSGVR